MITSTNGNNGKEKAKRVITILCAEDDEEDRILLKEALEESKLAGRIHFVSNGEELTDYLYRRGKYAELAGIPLPSLILLDLNMPRKDGREALMEIKADPVLRRIPVVVLTSSKAEDDVISSYEMGVSGFIAKPPVFESLVEVVKALGKYWLEIVELPPEMIQSEASMSGLKEFYRSSGDAR